jgi:sugar phosphate isomerase/epimerase
MKEKKYRFGLSTTIDYTVPIDNQLDMMAGAGFNFISLGARLEHCHFFQPEKFMPIKDKAAQKKMASESVHAPFGREADIASDDIKIRQKAIESIKNVMQLASQYEIPILILHPHDHFGSEREKCLERAVDSLKEISILKPDGLQIALENMPGKDSAWIIGNLFNLFGPEKYGFCYDSSHENITEPGFPLLKSFYNRLITCHLSDNNGSRDEHLTPGLGNIDWKQIRRLFDMSETLTNVLFEVGTGAALPDDPDKIIKSIFHRANEIFADN